MARIRKKLLKYSRVLGGRIYRPVRPVLNPLLKRVKLVHVLVGLVILGLGGSLWGGWQPRGNERAGWWPWSAKSHAEMALVWFENGNEVEAVRELELANRLLVIKTQTVEDNLKRAEEKVRQPGKIRGEIESWEKVLEEKPYYRDVLLRLALLSYQIYEDEKAQEYFERAKYLDPNNEEVKKIDQIIFSLP